MSQGMLAEDAGKGGDEPEENTGERQVSSGHPQAGTIEQHTGYVEEERADRKAIGNGISAG